MYGPDTLEANWVEERADRGFRSEWRSKELRPTRVWSTEHSSMYGLQQADPEYRDRLRASELGPPTISPSPHANVSRPYLVHYAADGFGASRFQDHSPDHKR
jgi:hypothetical protein